jgi:RNA polymerase sigma-70 factor (ECF subfamily)
MLDEELVRRLHARAEAGRWRVSADRLRVALQASVARAPASTSDRRALETYLSALHLADLALACACADGDEPAWEHFVRELRPVLYRAADSLEPGGGAREIADAMYADLYGIREHDGGRRSLLRYFHGRSSLATWLRAVLAQRYVDRRRVARRETELPNEDSPAALPAADRALEPDRPRFLGLLQQALADAVSRLVPRDRLRLGCYYAQGLTLAETGRVLQEHEATVSRQLARARRAIRVDVERVLRETHGLSDAEVGECLASAVEDSGPLDVRELLEGRKEDRTRSFSGRRIEETDV